MKLYCGITDIGEWCVGEKVGKNLIKVNRNVFHCKNIKVYKEQKNETVRTEK